MRKKRKHRLFLAVSSWLIQLLIHSLLWSPAYGKGIGVIGKGGGSGEGKWTFRFVVLAVVTDGDLAHQ